MGKCMPLDGARIYMGFCSKIETRFVNAYQYLLYKTVLQGSIFRWFDSFYKKVTTFHEI